MAEAEQQRALGRESVGEQPLDRLQDGEEVALVVDRAASPHVAAVDHALEGRMRPARVGPALDRHHVLVREQQQRRQLGPSTLPGVEQTGAVHELARERGMHARVAALQIGAECLERRGVDGGPVLGRDRAEAQSSRQPARGRVRVDRHDGGHGDRGCARAERGGADPEHREQEQERDGGQLRDPPHAKPCSARPSLAPPRGRQRRRSRSMRPRASKQMPSRSSSAR